MHYTIFLSNKQCFIISLLLIYCYVRILVGEKMKVKYLRLSKDEKIKEKEAFYQTKKGIIVRKNLRNGRICAILCLFYALYLFIDYWILKNGNISNIIYAILLIIFGIGSLIFAHHIFIKSINNYVTSDKK